MITLLTCIATTMQAEHNVNLDLNAVAAADGASYDSSTHTATFSQGWKPVYWNLSAKMFSSATVTIASTVDYNIRVTIRYYANGSSTTTDAYQTLSAGSTSVTVDVPANATGIHSLRVMGAVNGSYTPNKTVILESAVISLPDEELPLSLTTLDNLSGATYNNSTKVLTLTNSTASEANRWGGWNVGDNSLNDYDGVVVELAETPPVDVTIVIRYTNTSDQTGKGSTAVISTTSTKAFASMPNDVKTIQFIIIRISCPAGETKTLTLKNAYLISSSKTFMMSSAGYATYYHSSATQLPAGMKAATVDGIGSSTLTLNWRYDGDNSDVIPGGTAVLLKGSEGDHTFTLLPSNTTAAPGGNLLDGSDRATTTSTAGADKYYKLSYNSSGENLGWYWGADGGAAFAIGAHKAWLALTDAQAASAPYFSLDDNSTTSLREEVKVNSEQYATAQIYDLQGRKVNAQPNSQFSILNSQLKKGLYIVNGKKVVIK